LQNDFEKAIENYDNALLLEPENVFILISRSNIEIFLGEFDLAIKGYNDALAICHTARDSAMVYAALSNYFTMKGQIQKSLYYYELEVAENKKSQTPLDYMVNQTFNIFKYVKAGKREKGMRILKELEPKFKPPVDKVIAFGYMFYYLELEDVEKVKPYIAEAKELIQGFGQEALMVMVFFAEGRIAELTGNYKEAISNYLKFYKQHLTDDDIMRRLGASYRKDGQMREAKEFLEKTLEANPYNSLTNLEMAKYYLDKGGEKKAEEHLKLALEVWKDADSDYKYAIEAQTMLQQLEGI
jgi:tetratricopeptide (TPR) repeat protein